MEISVIITDKPKFTEIDKSVKEMLKKADTFDERAKSIEVAIKFESLRLKAKGGSWGRGFTEEFDDDNE